MAETPSTAPFAPVLPPEPGDWVLVWGQVSPEQEGHPEDLTVTVSSHNEHIRVPVRRDRVVCEQDVPEFAEQCTHLHEVEVLFPHLVPDRDNLLAQCTRHHGHSGKHRDRSGREWGKSKTAGYFEEA